MYRLLSIPINKVSTKTFCLNRSLFGALNQSKALFSSTTNNNDPKIEEEAMSHIHFKASKKPHPLMMKKLEIQREEDELAGDHTGRLQNHIWTKEELDEKMSTLYHYEPKTISDHVMNNLMFGLYHSFNFVTGYNPLNPSVQAMQWRLITLESVAGVPGFVAAAFRHFRSLRRLQRDHGWISTLLEEAENERMHLLICLSTFNASVFTRYLVIAAQYMMTPFLAFIYTVHPKSMHRFVGYLEETACKTYLNTIKHIETPGTDLHKEWSVIPAPPIAIGYYKLPKDAMWVDTLKCMMADEANHRDVNHTFADMKVDDPNPFLEVHRENAAKAWRLNQKNESAWTK